MRVHSTEWIIQQVDIGVEIYSTSKAHSLFLSTTEVDALKKAMKTLGTTAAIKRVLN